MKKKWNWIHTVIFALLIAAACFYKYNQTKTATEAPLHPSWTKYVNDSTNVDSLTNDL